MSSKIVGDAEPRNMHLDGDRTAALGSNAVDNEAVEGNSRL